MRRYPNRLGTFVVIAITVFVLVVTGCSSKGSGGGGGGGGGGASGSCGGTGTGVGSGMAVGNILKIGFQGPLSGASRQLGLDVLGGIKVAVDQANRSRALPYTLEVVPSDDAGSPAQGPIAARRLVDAGAVAVVGPMSFGTTTASEPVLCQFGVLSVTPSATNSALTSLGFSNFARVIVPDTVQGKAAADYLVQTLKAEKVFSLDDRSDYATGLSGALEARLRTDGVQVVHDGLNPTKDYTAEATKIVTEDPDAVYYSGYADELALLARALKAQGYSGKILSGDAANDDTYVAQAGADVANGTYLTCACADVSADPRARDFLTRYGAVNAGAQPGRYSAEAYDATTALVAALLGLGANADRASTSAAFRQVNVAGLTKRIAFQSNGELKGEPVYVYQVTGGHRKVLGLVSELAKQ